MTHLPPRHETATKVDLHEAIAPVRADIALLTARVDNLEERFTGLEDRFGHMEDRFDRLYEGIDGRLEGMHTLMHTQFRNYSIVAGSFMTGLTAVFGVMLAAFG